MNQALPPAIQRQLDEAAEIERQLAATPAEPGTTAATETDPAIAQQPSEEPPQAVVTTTPQADSWEQKFNVLQGKYNAELPRLHQQLREMADELAVVRDKLKTPEQPVEPKPERVTDKDREDFGADLLDAAARAAEDVFDRREAVLKAWIEKVVSSVAGHVQTVEQRQEVSDNQRFWNAVRGVHNDFDTVNADPKWFDFLDKRVAGTRFTRRKAAEKAIADFDAEALAELVTEYKATLPPPVAQTNKVSTELQSQVTPSTSQVSKAAPVDTGRIWTGAEYDAAFDPRNAKRMTNDEWSALQAEADRAHNEGRVRW